MRPERPPRAPLADAATLLARALIADAARAGLTVRSLAHRSHEWSSATFVGERHEVSLIVDGDAADWLAALPTTDLPLRGHIVADLRVVGADGDAAVRIEVLTIEER